MDAETSLSENDQREFSFFTFGYFTHEPDKPQIQGGKPDEKVEELELGPIDDPITTSFVAVEVRNTPEMTMKEFTERFSEEAEDEGREWDDSIQKIFEKVREHGLE